METINQLVGIKLNKEEVEAISYDLAKVGRDNLSQASIELLDNLEIKDAEVNFKILLSANEVLKDEIYQLKQKESDLPEPVKEDENKEEVSENGYWE